MTRDDLIEMLAREMADVREDVTWERVSDKRKFLYRGDAASMLPGVVKFVEAWLVSKGGCISDHNPEALSTADWIATSWQKDMA